MTLVMLRPLGWLVLVVAVTTGMLIALSTFHSHAADRVGDISYSLYLLHLPIGVAVIGCLSHWLPYASWFIGILDVIGVAASAWAAWIMCQFIEKPSQETCRRLYAFRIANQSKLHSRQWRRRARTNCPPVIIQRCEF